MNWTTWSSVRANVDRKMPRLTAPRAVDDDHEEGEERAPGDRQPRPTENVGRGPRAGTATLPKPHASRMRDLERGEEPEAEQVAGDDLAAGHRASP